jgi:hypothetical protein
MADFNIETVLSQSLTPFFEENKQAEKTALVQEYAEKLREADLASENAFAIVEENNLISLGFKYGHAIAIIKFKKGTRTSKATNLTSFSHK